VFGKKVGINNAARGFPCDGFCTVFAEAKGTFIVIAQAQPGQSKPRALFMRMRLRKFFSAALLSKTKRVVASSEPQPPAAARYGLI